jgi:uncharacterized protein YegJ (DUF2314 family)
MPLRLPPRLVALMVIGGVIAASYLFSSPPKTIMEKTKRDHVIQVKRGDPDMDAAFSKAKSTMDEFLAMARAPKPSMEGFAVKVPIREDDTQEFFWISPFVEKDGNFQGRVTNTPRSVRKVRQGETITFLKSDIADWTYKQNGRMFGNFTTCALLKNEPDQADAFRKQYGLVCD